ncbi:MAG: AAA family ATPase [Candidatus Omnitrophota bacterium]
MTLKLLSIDEYVQNVQHVHAAIKGPHGSGKTTVATAAARVWSPTLVIDAEGGQLSAAHFAPRSDFFIADVRSKDPRDHDEFFRNLGEALAEAMSEKYKLVVVDSMGEVVSRMIDQYAKDSKSGMPSQSDWFGLTGRARAFTRTLRDLKKHTVVTFLTEKIKEDKTIYDVALPGQLSTEIPAMYDILALTQKKQGPKGELQHWFTTSGQPVFQVRSRLQGLASEEFIDPSKPWCVWEKIDGLHKALFKANGAAVPAPAKTA